MATCLRIIRNTTMPMIVRITAITVSHGASGPPPTIIGIGPMNMKPPKLAEPLPDSIAATVKTTTLGK